MTQELDNEQSVSPFRDPVADGLKALEIKDIAAVPGRVPPGRAARASARARAEASPSPHNWARNFGNNCLNSRSALPLGLHAWQIAWKLRLDPALNPTSLLLADNRIMLAGSLAWELADRRGKSLSRGIHAPGDLVLDPAQGLMIHTQLSSMIAGVDLADGALRFKCLGVHGADFQRQTIFCTGTRLLSVSYAKQSSPQAPVPARASLHLRDLGDPIRTSAARDLKSGATLATLHLAAATLRVAMAEGRVVIAARNRLYFTDGYFKIEQAFSGEFEPLALSLDEQRWIYLVVAVNGGRELWILDGDGARRAKLALPAMAGAIRPPMVGCDHRVWVVSSRRMAAFEADGRAGATIDFNHPAGGAMIADDDQAAVAVGSDILAYDASGKARTLFSVAGETFLTAPVLADGVHGEELLVASERHLYCLTPKLIDPEPAEPVKVAPPTPKQVVPAEGVSKASASQPAPAPSRSWLDRVKGLFGRRP